MQNECGKNTVNHGGKYNEWIVLISDVDMISADSMAVDVAVLTVAVAVAEAGGTDVVAGWAVVAAAGVINNY